MRVLSMYKLIRKGLFALDAEQAHNTTIKLLRAMSKLPKNGGMNMLFPKPKDNPTTCMGITFKNPIGLAAGADKNGEAIDGFGALGFGFVEVGTVTPLAQDGNAKPRQFRLIDEEGIINRNGFNNYGVDYLIEQVKNSQYDGVIGINIGKNTITSIENGISDYLFCLNRVYEYADYITVNISSPNSPGLRQLQYGDALDALLQSIKAQQKVLTDKFNRYVPIAVKIAPDQTEAEIIQIADTLVRHKMDGVIATNTTISRDTVYSAKNAHETGGLSGKPLQNMSNQFILRLSKELNGTLPIIGSGGIDSVADGQQKIDNGASLLQLYSGLIYHGPALVKALAEGVKLK